MKPLLSIACLIFFSCIHPQKSLATIVMRDTIGIDAKNMDNALKELKTDSTNYDFVLTFLPTLSVPLTLTAIFAKHLASEAFLWQFVTVSVLSIWVYALIAFIAFLVVKRKLKKKLYTNKKPRFFKSLFLNLLYVVVGGAALATFFAIFITQTSLFLFYLLSIFHIFFGLCIIAMALNLIFTGRIMR
jgi:hypothetical protein